MIQRSRRFIWGQAMNDRSAHPALEIRGLNVFYGASHALQGVDLTLDGGVLSVVGRNGMGKTTLCKTVMGLLSPASGSIAMGGQPVPRGDTGAVARKGVGYVPQGRRLWPSLSVQEHLAMLARPGGSWSVERIYDVFPRLAERRGNGGGQLSGGEQQMLAIARALLTNPNLLIMDEPTEGLAPVIVDQVSDLLTTLAAQGEMDILVIEQNIRVACAVSEQVAIMRNGRIDRIIDSDRLAADKSLQQALLGVGRLEGGDEDADDANTSAVPRPKLDFVYTVNPKKPRRWTGDLTQAQIQRQARAVTANKPVMAPQASALIRKNPVRGAGGIVIVAGTMDTKAAELRYVRDILRRQGLVVRLADVSLQSAVTGADIPAHEIATLGAAGRQPMGDRVEQMAAAFARYVDNRSDIAGVLALGGSGGSAIVAPALQVLAVGVPKVLVTTMGAGNVAPYVGVSDVTIVPAVTDLGGLNRISRQVLGNAAHALAGMVKSRQDGPQIEAERPAAALTMFGVTTPCVTAVSEAISTLYEPIVFHATGTGGRSMEALVAEGQVQAVFDLTTTEIADHIVGGVLSAGPTRLDVFARANIPYIGAAGALDMVNFGGADTVPEAFKSRRLYAHNPHVTLMRTTPEDARKIGQFIADKLNRISAPVRFYLPEGGLSALDTKGGVFEDANANAALFETIERETHQSSARRILRVPHHINDAEFATAIAREVPGLRLPQPQRGRLAHG